jgi:hypothetical protein
MIDLYKTKEQLKTLIERPDVDTICAFDYVKMKKNALGVNGLHYKDFNPAAQGIMVPKFPEL